ncbi:MAG: ISAs1 family transposase [Saprospiraceae bacterium]
MEQETTFYQELQGQAGLDLRDRRGRKHDIVFILLGVMVGLLRNRDGNLSSIHRCMVNTHCRLCELLGVEIARAVSRAQLPRILASVNGELFEQMLFKLSKIELSGQERKWFAGDGKELRGSIEKGDKRGEVSVQLVRQEDGRVIGQAFYNGTKESEKPCLQQLVETTGVKSQKITADALHLHPCMTQMVAQAGGVFVIGLKDNQKELLQDMVDHTKAFAPSMEHKTIDKGHGRLEIRQYACFDVSGEYFESRWVDSRFSSLIAVKRTRTVLKNNDSSEEMSYYLSNGKCKNALEYFQAVRNHWSIEVNNHYRDVSLKEDEFRTKKNLLQSLWQALEPLSWNYYDDGIPAMLSLKWSDFRITLTSYSRL